MQKIQCLLCGAKTLLSSDPSPRQTTCLVNTSQNANVMGTNAAKDIEDWTLYVKQIVIACVVGGGGGSLNSIIASPKPTSFA